MHLDVSELVVVIRLECTVHTDIEQSIAILQDAVHIAARHPLMIIRLFFDGLELIAIIFVQSVTCGYPDESVTVLIDLTGKAARQLFVGIKQLPHLCLQTQADD